MGGIDAASPAYPALWCKSNFSFLEGASHPEELIQTCRRLGVPAIALTDRDGVYGIVRAHVETQKPGPAVQLIVGSEVTVGARDSEPHSAPATDPPGHLILLVRNRSGYANLCRLISVGRLHSPKGQSLAGWDEVAAHADGLIALWEGRAQLAAEQDQAWLARATQLRRAFGADCFYALVTRHYLPDDAAIEARQTRLAQRLGVPQVAATEVLYHDRRRRPLQDVVTCIRHGTSLAAAGTLLRPNAEHYLRPPAEFAHLFADRPELLAATATIAARCRFSLGELRYRYPSEQLPHGLTSMQWLRRLAFNGAEERYANDVPPEVTAQLETELQLIEELDFSGYFLTMWEIVQFCRRNGILCQGRGSAANSAVCFCLGVTAIDPVKMHLLFERFLSRERAEPPDIDLDIGHRRREEVIQFVYQKYGRDRAAMVANLVRYRAKSAIREVGKALGFPLTVMDRVARLVTHHDRDFGTAVAMALEQAGLDPEGPAQRQLRALAAQIRDFPRHLSIHPGGFLLGSEPVSDFVPIENATMADRTVIQWDKYDVEALGLFKVDLLGLGALTHLDFAFEAIRDHYQRDYSMATVPFGDAEVFDMVTTSDTVGVFQIESRAQMSMLPRLRPRTFYDLVIEVSIVRPGPITGGMVHPYLRRRNGEEPVDYPHPALRPVLEKTLGVPLFQEQVMKLAVVAADYTPGEADQLRRDMAAWRRSGRIEKHGEKLISRMMAKGIAREFAERVFQQIRGFGEYGFPESHAASFALIGYLTAWVKCHYPDVFASTLLNAWPMGFYSPATIVDDARRHGVTVLPVDIVSSRWYCTLEPLKDAKGESGNGDVPSHAVRMGLRFVKGLAETVVEELLAARDSAAFTSIEDLVERVPRLPQDGLVQLAESGALNRLVASEGSEGSGRGSRHAARSDARTDHRRRPALWQVIGASRLRERERSDAEANPRQRRRLAIHAPEAELAFSGLDAFDSISWDYQSAGHSTRGHPLEPFRRQLRSRQLPDAADVAAMEDGSRASYAGLVICRQRPGTAAGVVFMTLEDEAGFVNLVVWPKVFERFRLVILGNSFLGVTGKVQAQHNVVHIIADSFWQPKLPVKPDDDRPGGPMPKARQTVPLKSRDFH